MKGEWKNLTMTSKEILKSVIVFDSILSLEKGLGTVLHLKSLINFLKDDVKRYNEKMSIKEIKEILDVLLTSGILITREKGYIERARVYKESQENKKGNISREVANAISNSISSGDLTITNQDGEETKDESLCDVCGKDIGICLNAYSYHIIVSDDKMVLEEKLFCTKKCWEKYLLKEAKKVK